MRFQCSHCKGIVAIDDAECGNPVGCGNCGSVTTVPETRFSPSAVINDFVIRKVIGHGGMGQVFLAHQMSLDRPVALKILMEQFSTDSEFIVDFVKEARAAARLNHPNIVQSYAVGEEDGIYFFAMEYVEGETLTELLHREGALPVERGINIVQQIGEALDFAWKHQQLVHRDVKPDNIMMTTRGVAKLADLGLARVASELLEDMEDDEVMGTPQYICPEQLLGQPMDIRGDIYSLGATFYQTITGKFPFEGKSAAEIARKHLQEPLIPPHEASPEVPEAVSYIIQKMMAKKAEDRYADGTLLANDLNLALRGEAPAGFTGKKGLKAAGAGKAKPPALPAEDAVPEAKPTSDDDAEEDSDSDSGGPKLKLSGKKTKLKLGGSKKKRKTLSLSKDADDSADDDDDSEKKGHSKTALKIDKTRELSAVSKQGGSKKGLIIGVGAAAAVGILLFIGGIVLYMSKAATYSPENFEEATALYFSVESADAQEQQAYEQLAPFIGSLDEHRDDIATLNRVVSLAYKFENDFPNSIFNLSARDIDYGEMFGTSFFADRIKPYAQQMATLIPRTRMAYEEQLIRTLRQQAHEEELQETQKTAEKLEEEEEWALVRKQIDQYIRRRQNELRKELNGFTGEVKRKETLLAEEQNEMRRAVFSQTMEHNYRQALNRLRQKSANKAAYGAPVTNQIESIKNQDELLEARSLERQLKREHRDLDERRLSDELRGAINGSEIKAIKEEMDSLTRQEEMVFLNREGWFKDMRESIEKAQAYWELVANTGDKLKDRKIDTRKVKVDPMQQVRINSIIADKMILNVVELNSQGKYETQETTSMQLHNLEVGELRELAERSFGQAGNPDDYTTMLGCYFYYRGGLSTARTELEKVGGQTAEFLIAEMEHAVPIVRGVRLEQFLVQLRGMAEAGEVERARAIYLQKLKPSFGDLPEFEASQAEMRELLQIPEEE